MNKFNLLKKEIWSIIPKSPIKSDLKHSKLVLKWVLILCPNACEELQISAIGHDIERAITGITEKNIKNYSKIKQFKKQHASRSAKLLSEILKKYNYSNKQINQVKYLVKNHDTGGDSDVEILMSADSLAYFEYNIPFYLKNYGEERTIEKCRFMYERLPESAKKLVKKIKYKSKKIDIIVNRAIEKNN
ncbi:MAG: DUF4202 family protein [Patescibacteria group bacterium]|nr:DUF4202 family protein [Patescibacteria group bacterium]